MVFYWNASRLYSTIAVIAGAFEGDDVGVELQQVRQGALVARHGLELELGVAAIGAGRQPMMARLLDLDAGHPAAARSRNSAFMMSKERSVPRRAKNRRRQDRE